MALCWRWQTESTAPNRPKGEDPAALAATDIPGDWTIMPEAREVRRDGPEQRLRIRPSSEQARTKIRDDRAEGGVAESIWPMKSRRERGIGSRNAMTVVQGYR